MDIKKVSGFENLGGINPGTQTPKGSGPSFLDTLNKVQGQDAVPNGIVKPGIAGEGDLKFSNHAVERMQSRGIRFAPESMAKLNEAVSKASSKGSKNSLILMDDTALIVSVKNRTVVTVMDKSALKDNVFTNIDSTIVM
jgi:flagellar operon protein